MNVLPSGYSTSSSYSSGSRAFGSSASHRPAGSLSSASTARRWQAGRAPPAPRAGARARRRRRPRPRGRRARRAGFAPSSTGHSASAAWSMSRSMPATGIPTQSGPVVELVAQLVDRLLELEHGEQALDRGLARRQQRRVDRLEVAVEEPLARPLLPVRRHVGVARELGGGRRVGERAEHPGDVAQRRALAAPLDERARRLALEVEDDPVLPRPEGLAEVVVAVRADHAAARAGVGEQAQLLADLLAAAEDRREALVVVGQREEDARDLLVDRRRQQPERLDARLLGREGRVVRVGAERGVHVRGHLAEPAQPVEEALGRRRDLVERELPAVDRAGDELLQEPERRRRAGRRSTRTSRRAPGCSGSRAR